MIAETVTFSWPLVFFGAAVVLFLLAAPHRVGVKVKGWFIPLGLACFAFAFFIGRFTA